MQVRIPDLWRSFPGTQGRLILSKDGASVANIVIDPQLPTKRAQERRLRGRSSRIRKRSAQGHVRSVDPNARAAAIQSVYASLPGLTGFELEGAGPAEFLGATGSRVSYRYRAANGLELRGVEYSTYVGSSLITCTYNAVQRHYYGLHLDAFEEVCRSAQLVQ